MSQAWWWVSRGNLQIIAAAFLGAYFTMPEIVRAFSGYITQLGKSYSNMAEYDMGLREFCVEYAVITLLSFKETNTVHFKDVHLDEWYLYYDWEGEAQISRAVLQDLPQQRQAKFSLKKSRSVAKWK